MPRQTVGKRMVAGNGPLAHEGRKHRRPEAHCHRTEQYVHWGRRDSRGLAAVAPCGRFLIVPGKNRLVIKLAEAKDMNTSMRHYRVRLRRSRRLPYRIARLLLLVLPLGLVLLAYVASR